MIGYLALFVDALGTLLFWLVIISVILSYFMDPYNPIRRAIDSVVDPMLAPIRRILPPIAGFDFSPVILAVLIQVVARIIVNLLLTLR